jgi:drug/metabolite transporter (DMT)-like permease
VTPERRGALYVAGAALLWSTSGIGIKAIPEPALTVAGVRSGIAAAALALVLRPRGGSLRPGFLLAVASYAACVTTFVVATKWTTAANAIFLQYSGVVWVLLASPLVLGEPLGTRDVAAVLLAVAGMALFFAGELGAPGRTGDVVALFSGVFYAATALSLRRERGASAEAAVTWGNALVAAALLPAAAPLSTMAPTSAAVLAALGVFQIAGGYLLFLRGLALVPATRAALVSMVEPIANPIWVLLVLGERPAPLALLGGAVVLGAIAWRTLAGAHAARDRIVADR